MFKAIAKPFGRLMLWLFGWTGNYGVAVILFALVVKLILLPFQLKSKKSMMRTARMTPRLKELEKKYGNDKQKYQEQVNKLYKEEGINPMSGCLWSLIPFPILIALYQAIRYPITIMMGVGEELLGEGGAIYEKLLQLGYVVTTYSTTRNAAAYEQIYQSQFITEHFDQFAGLADRLQTLDYGFLGLDLGQVPNWKFWTFSGEGWAAQLGLFLIPLLSAFLSWLSMRISNASNPQTMDQQQTSKTMMLYMPLISLWICFTMPGVMGIYWIAQSVFSIIQDVILTRIYNKQLDIEDADRIERERAREAELEAKRQETERQRAEGTTQQNRNTSKKKMQAAQSQKETERKAAEARALRAAKRGPDGEEIPASQVGDRRYARGRAYVPDRYTNPDEAEEKTALAAGESDEFEALHAAEVIEDTDTASAQNASEPLESSEETGEPAAAPEAEDADFEPEEPADADDADEEPAEPESEEPVDEPEEPADEPAESDEQWNSEE